MKSKKIIVLIVSLVIIFLIVALLYIILYNNNRIMSNNTPIESSKFNSQTDNQVHDTNKNMTIVDISQSNNSTNTVVNLNDKRDLTTIEIAEVKKFLNDKNNSNFLNFALDFKSYEDINFEDIISFANIAFTKEHSSEEIEKVYVAEVGTLAGGGIISATGSNVQKIYKEKFNAEVSKEYIKNMPQNNRRIYYNSQNDLLMYIPDGYVDSGLWVSFNGTVQNNRYIINLEYAPSYENYIIRKTLTLVKVDNEFYFESLLTDDGQNLDVTSELVKELYGYIPNASDICRWDKITNTMIYPLDAYRSKKVTIADIDNQVILKEAFYNKEIEVGVNAFVTEGTEEALQRTHVGECPWYDFKEEVLEEAVSKIYGNSVSIEHETFDLSQISNCRYTPEKNMYSYSWGGRRWYV